MNCATADLCDDHPKLLETGELSVLPPVFRHFGRRAKFCGPAVTLRVFEDNGLLRATLEAPGHGCVLVVDAGGSLRCALVGAQLAQLAEDNGWAGILLDGCVRDSDELNQREVGVRALGTHPLRCRRDGAGERNGTACLAGVHIHPGDWVYADGDGIVVARRQLA